MNTNVLEITLVTVLVSWLALGCSTSGASARSREMRQSYLVAHADLSMDVQTAIQERRVIRGMTKEQVRASWGGPSTMEDFSTYKNAAWYEEDEEGWIYRPSLLSIGPTRSVTFKDGVVVGTSESYK